MRVQQPDFAFWRDAQQRCLAPNKWGTRIDRLPPPEFDISCEAADEIVGLDEKKARDYSAKPVPAAKIADVTLSGRGEESP